MARKKKDSGELVMLGTLFAVVVMIGGFLVGLILYLKSQEIERPNQRQQAGAENPYYRNLPAPPDVGQSEVPPTPIVDNASPPAADETERVQSSAGVAPAESSVAVASQPLDVQPDPGGVATVVAASSERAAKPIEEPQVASAQVPPAAAPTPRLPQNVKLPPISLGLPLICHPGKTCWVVNLMDHDPGPGRLDYRCGPFTYDRHKGVDIAIRDQSVMRAGVPVVASAPGRVSAVRDGVDDVSVKVAGYSAVEGKDCGNGVVIDHAGGWQTQYCHLRNGSVDVRKGQQVSEGEPIGLVGLSGRTEFPHVHLSVRQAGKLVDPFVGQPGRRGTCDEKSSGVWRSGLKAALTPHGTQIYNAGIAGEEPNWRRISLGSAQVPTLSRIAPALILWVEAFTATKGEAFRLRLQGPNGEPISEQNIPIEKSQIRRRFYIGRKRPGGAWPVGVYVGFAWIIGTDGVARDRRTVQANIQ